MHLHKQLMREFSESAETFLPVLFTSHVVTLEVLKSNDCIKLTDILQLSNFNLFCWAYFIKFFIVKIRGLIFAM